MKTIIFDASEVKVTTRTANVLSVEAEIQFQNEVLDEFGVDDIIANYSDLEMLYEALKGHYND